MNNGGLNAGNYSQYLTSATLAEALSRYTDPSTRQAYSEVANANLTPAEPPKDLMSGMWALSNIITQASNKQFNQKKLLADLKAQILELIKTGDLIAYGFNLPRQLNDQPIKIPLDIIISGEINWENSEIKYKNLEFTGVRLLENKKSELKLVKSDNITKLNVINKNAEKANLSDLKPDLYINEKEAGEYLGLSHRTLQGLRLKGGGPEFRKFNKIVRYKMADLIKWAESKKRDNTV